MSQKAACVPTHRKMGKNLSATSPKLSTMLSGHRLFLNLIAV